MFTSSLSSFDNGQNPGEVSMDSNSLEKTLNSILNTLPRTLAPLEAIKILRNKSLKKKVENKKCNLSNEIF